MCLPPLQMPGKRSKVSSTAGGMYMIPCVNLMTSMSPSDDEVEVNISTTRASSLYYYWPL